MAGLLAAGQVACSLVLLIAAGLLMRSFDRLLEVNPGFEAQHLLTMNISLSTTRYSKGQQQIAFFEELLDRLSHRAGIHSVAVSAALPLSSKRITPVLAEGQPEVPLAQRPFVDIEAISPQWFRTMGVSLRSGRAFEDQDGPTSPSVAIVNMAFAQQYWPGQNALGKKITIGRRLEPALVVGVSTDVRNRGLDRDAQPQLYVPFAQLPWSDMNLLVRTNLPVADAIASVRSQIGAIDTEQPLSEVQAATDLLDHSRAQPRFISLLLEAFSAVALLIAIVGVYGVLSYSVAQRWKEFGIRMALGAKRTDILGIVIRQGMLLTSVGCATGICAALLLTKLLGTVLYKTDARDMTTFIGAPILFFTVAAAASYMPARRAMSVDPIEVLK
jgi:putative ABC transport system permease protein